MRSSVEPHGRAGGVRGRFLTRSLRDACATVAAWTTRRTWIGYAWAVGATAACTAIGLAMHPRFDLVNIAMVYLLGGGRDRAEARSRRRRSPPRCCASRRSTTCSCRRAGRSRSTTSQYLLTFAIMVAVALVISRLVETRAAPGRARRPPSRSRPRPSASAARCSRRSRTICARRSRSWPARRRAWPTRRALDAGGAPRARGSVFRAGARRVRAASPRSCK